jgi:hypothetical protein
MAKPKKPSIYERPGKTDKDDKVADDEREQFLDESEEHSGEVETKMRSGYSEVNVYTSEGREELIEDDEVSTWEEGFAEGETEPEIAHCAACGSVLSQKEENVIEREIQHVRYMFCSRKCAASGVQHAKKK